MIKANTVPIAILHPFSLQMVETSQVFRLWKYRTKGPAYVLFALQAFFEMVCSNSSQVCLPFLLTMCDISSE